MVELLVKTQEYWACAPMESIDRRIRTNDSLDRATENGRLDGMVVRKLFVVTVATRIHGEVKVFNAKHSASLV